MFTPADFKRLLDINNSDERAVTIYIPTHRAGQQTHSGHDRIVWKDAVKQVRHRLESTGLSGIKLDAFLQPLMQLEQDATFWTHQSDTLAAYLYDGQLETFALPIESDQTRVYTGRTLALAPAAGMLGPAARYYIFTLSLGGTAFYEATKHSITPVYIHDQVPTDMEEVLEVYEGSESLQWHGAGTKGTGAIFHGQGSNEDRLDERKRIYFERVSAGLDKLLAGQEEPLMIVCDAQHATEFKRNLKYPHVYQKAIDINPENLSAAELHTETWAQMQPHFDKTYADLSARVETAVGLGRFVGTAQDAVPAAINGQVDTLFVASDQPTPFGTFDPSTNAVNYHEEQQADSQDLMELAIRHTVKNSGKVFSRASFVLPNAVDTVGAILRY